MMIPLVRAHVFCAALTVTAVAACGDDDHDHVHDGGDVDAAGTDAGGAPVAHTLFATEGQTLVSFDIATGTPRAETIGNVKGPVDMQALESGHVLVNLTDNGEILVVDARTFPAKARVSISNIADCSTVLQVIDYGNAATPLLVKKWSAAELDPARDCAMQGASPHGAAAAANGRGYHNFTGWGVIAAVDQTADAPTVKLLPTKGNGAGYTKAAKDGRYVYSLQRTPREGDAVRPGVSCQIGQLVVVDSMTDTLVAETAILLTGGSCTAKLPDHAKLAGPDHIKITTDGKGMFVTTQAAPPMGSMEVAYSDQLVVFDLSDRTFHCRASPGVNCSS